MTESTRQDRFNKADAAFKKACAEVNDTYAAWSDACDRLMRIGKERLEAWGDLVEGVLEIDANRPADHGKE